MNCHTCPHSEDVMRGVYRSNPWVESPCANCKLRENTLSTVPYDDAHPPADAIPLYGDKDPDEKPDLLPLDVFEHFIRRLLALSPEQRDVVSWRYQGLEYKDIAERQGVSVQCVEMRHKLAMKNWPALESLFPFKVACSRYRRSRKQDVA